MGKKILDLVEFFIERPPLTGALVWGVLYVVKRRRGSKKPLSTAEKTHALDVYEKQRPYADKMYDPPEEQEDEKHVKPA